LLSDFQSADPPLSGADSLFGRPSGKTSPSLQKTSRPRLFFPRTQRAPFPRAHGIEIGENRLSAPNRQAKKVRDTGGARGCAVELTGRDDSSRCLRSTAKLPDRNIPQ